MSEYLNSETESLQEKVEAFKQEQELIKATTHKYKTSFSFEVQKVSEASVKDIIIDLINQKFPSQQKV